MPEKQIQNPGGVFGLTADPNPTVREMVNNSAGTLLAGDVVVVAADVTGCKATTTTTASDLTTLGVVAARTPSDSLTTQASTDTYAVGAVMPVIIEGPARVNIAANAVAAGVVIGSSTAAKVAAAATSLGGNLGVSLESQAAKDANNTIRCYIKRT